MKICELGRQALRFDLEVRGGFRDAEFLCVQGGDFGGVEGRGVAGDCLSMVGRESLEGSGELYFLSASGRVMGLGPAHSLMRFLLLGLGDRELVGEY